MFNSRRTRGTMKAPPEDNPEKDASIEIESASGDAVPVTKPLGQRQLAKLATDDVISAAAAARDEAGLSE